eukprot:30422-Pelagococcus_subviridis.AAC.5
MAATAARHAACIAYASRVGATRPFSSSRAVTRAVGGQRAALLGGDDARARWTASTSANKSSSSSSRRARTFLTVHAKKKGFAELLGNLAPPSADDYNGRPRLVKGTVSAKQHVPASIPRPPYADNGFLPGAFYTLVPIRPRWRCGRRSLRTFPG